MQTKVIFALAAIVLLAAVYAASEAFARGGGGGGGGRGGHGGMISGFHGFASHGMRRMGQPCCSLPVQGATLSRDAQRRTKAARPPPHDGPRTMAFNPRLRRSWAEMVQHAGRVAQGGELRQSRPNQQRARLS